MVTLLSPAPDRVASLLEESAFLYAFLVSRLGSNRSAAEDLTQETLLAALEGDYDPARGPMRSWLIGIALRKIVDHRRRRRIDERHQSALAHELSLRMAREPLPPEWIEREEVRSLVNLALARLPEVVAVLLLRKYFDGASVAELAAERGLTEKAIEGQLGRGRVLLQDTIERLAKEGGS